MYLEGVPPEDSKGLLLCVWLNLLKSHCLQERSSVLQANCGRVLAEHELWGERHCGVA